MPVSNVFTMTPVWAHSQSPMARVIAVFGGFDFEGGTSVSMGFWEWCWNWSVERHRAVDGWSKVLAAAIAIGGILIGLIQLNSYLDLRLEENQKREREVQTSHQELVTRLYQMDYDLQRHVSLKSFHLHMHVHGSRWQAVQHPEFR